MMAENEKTEEDKANELEARIKAPLIWIRHGIKFRVEDLREKKYEEALDLFKNYFFISDTIYKYAGISDDEESMEEFLTNARIQMKDKTCLVAVEEETERIMAAGIIRVVDKSGFSRTISKTKLTTGKVYSTIITFTNALEKMANIHEIYETLKYLKIYHVVIDPEYSKTEIILTEIYKAATRLSQALKIPIVSGVFNSRMSQNVAESLGFKKLAEKFYQTYLVEHKMVFSKPEAGNYGASLMVVEVKPDREENEMVSVL